MVLFNRDMDNHDFHDSLFHGFHIMIYMIMASWSNSGIKNHNIQNPMCLNAFPLRFTSISHSGTLKIELNARNLDDLKYTLYILF